jgi:hypothetical protein
LTRIYNCVIILPIKSQKEPNPLRGGEPMLGLSNARQRLS